MNISDYSGLGLNSRSSATGKISFGPIQKLVEEQIKRDLVRSIMKGYACILWNLECKLKASLYAHLVVEWSVCFQYQKSSLTLIIYSSPTTHLTFRSRFHFIFIHHHHSGFHQENSAAQKVQCVSKTRFTVNYKKNVYFSILL